MIAAEPKQSDYTGVVIVYLSLTGVIDYHKLHITTHQSALGPSLLKSQFWFVFEK